MPGAAFCFGCEPLAARTTRADSRATSFFDSASSLDLAPGLSLPAAKTASTGYAAPATTALELAVHMNGRIYDPLIGRMLSADVVVQFPMNLQSFNRYSYVFNNPLSLIDPSGWTGRKPQNLLETVQLYIHNHREIERARQEMPIHRRALDSLLGVSAAMHQGNDTMLLNALEGAGYGVITTEQQVSIIAPVVGREIALDVSLLGAVAAIVEQLAKETDGSDQQNEERLPEPATGSDGGRVNQGAKDAPAEQTQEETQEWIYGPENDGKVNEDGSTNDRTWTTPDDFESQEEAQDKLDPFKPAEGRRRATVPAGSTVKRGITPGHDPNGPYDGEGGARETLHEEGLPPGSVGPWEPIPRKEDL
ncbi:MAG: RHS repeat-associated core domain-containing protein [Opitutaceae bacterium]